MGTYRIRLVAGEKNLKTDLKASSEDSARSAAQKWFDGARWQVVEVRRLAD